MGLVANTACVSNYKLKNQVRCVVEELLKEILNELKAQKAEPLWDIDDLMTHYKCSRSHACKIKSAIGFPSPVRATGSKKDQPRWIPALVKKFDEKSMKS